MKYMKENNAKKKKNLCTMTAKEIKNQTVSCKQDPLRAAGIFLNFLLLLSVQTRLKKN